MCIAIYKPEGCKLPSEDTLHECWWANSQGAGIAWYDQDTKLWTINKGFMTWDAYLTAWNKIHGEVNLESRQVMTHFRISTSGLLNSGECTHPFPVTNDEKQINALEITTPNIVMHNGVVGPGEGDHSDTQVAILEDIHTLYEKLEEDERIYHILHRVLKADSCRWMVALEDSVWTWGKWIVDDEIYYSNSGYKSTEKSWQKKKAGKPEPPVLYRGRTSRWNQHNTDNVIHLPHTPNHNSEASGAHATSIPVMAMSEHRCDILEIDNKDVHYILLDNGVIDWKGWYAWCISQSAQSLDSVGPSEENIIEVYDSNTKELLCLVDEKGEVCWDSVDEGDEYEDDIANDDAPLLATCPNKKCGYSQIDYEYDESDGYCPDCGQFLAVVEIELDVVSYECSHCGVELDEDSLLKDGGCPVCGEGTVRIVKDGNAGQTVAECPNCEEINHVIESTEPVGDSECCRCGAIWDSRAVSPAVIMYQQSVHTVWRQRQALMGLGQIGDV